jgi:NADPH-dependent F420 reductase
MIVSVRSGYWDGGFRTLILLVRSKPDMDVAILGGTGDFGRGLALRLAIDTDHAVVIGSRDPERGREAAEDYRDQLRRHDGNGSIDGTGNSDATAGAEVVVCSVPAYHLTDTIESVADALEPGNILVSPAVGMKGDEDGMHYNRPGAGSVTALAAGAAPDGVPVVGAFHSLAAGRLADLDAELGADTLVVGDDEDAVERVVSLADGIEGLRALRAGPMANAPEVEALTPLLINLAEYNDDLHDAVVRFD